MDQKRRDALIAELVEQVERRKLTTPAIMFLEANRPFSFIVSQLLFVAEPVVGLFFQNNRAREYALLLEDRQNVELLLQQFEAKR